jgi:hypothetical protein
MESNSDDEYEPWPGCYMGRTGAKSSSHYRNYYYLKPEFCAQFGLDSEKIYTYGNMEDAIIDYAKKNAGIERHNINYDSVLWSFLGIDVSEKLLKFYKLEKYLGRWTLKSAEIPTAVLFGRPYIR